MRRHLGYLLIFIPLLAGLYFAGNYYSSNRETFFSDLRVSLLNPVKVVVINGSCEVCDTTSFDKLVELLRTDLRATVEFKEAGGAAQDKVVRESSIGIYPSIKIEYSKLQRQGGLHGDLLHFLDRHSDLQAGVVWGENVVIAPNPSALFEAGCGPRLEYFAGGGTFEKPEERVVEGLRERFPDLDVRKFCPNCGEAAEKYMLIARPVYVVNCHYRKFGSGAVANATAEIQEVSRLICAANPSLCDRYH